METLQLLGTALGLSALAGLNLYLTVFVTGLALRLGWLELAPGLEPLMVLADPVVLTVAGVMLVLELVVDKVPYADNGWDTLHTVIRPVGGAIIGLKALGTISPQLDVIGALLGGTVAFTTHATKAGTRLLVNTSPEPVSNFIVSLTENAIVAVGVWFVFRHPLLALIILILFIVAFWYFAPRFFRMIKAYAVAVWHRLWTRPPRDGQPLSRALPEFALEPWLAVQHGDEAVAWAVPCFTGRDKIIGRHVRSVLIGTTGGRLVLIGRRLFRARYRIVDVKGANWTEITGGLFSTLCVQPPDAIPLRVRFTRRVSRQVPAILAWLEKHRSPSPSLVAAST